MKDELNQNLHKDDSTARQEAAYFHPNSRLEGFVPIVLTEFEKAMRKQMEEKVAAEKNSIIENKEREHREEAQRVQEILSRYDAEGKGKIRLDTVPDLVEELGRDHSTGQRVKQSCTDCEVCLTLML